MIALNKNVEEQARQEEELKGLDDVEKVYRGYTQKELHIAFNLVANKSDWKDPTSTKISATNLAKYREVIEAAVIYFTGSCAEFVCRKDHMGGVSMWCTFDGYYRCIGG